MTTLRPTLVAALLAASLTSCGAGAGEASCVAVVEVEGASYYDEVVDEQVPTTGEQVGAVLPACNDTNVLDESDEQVRVDVIEGVPADVAVTHDGVLYVREGARMPPSAAAWFDSASCTGSAPFRLAGKWTGVSEPAAPYFDGVLDPPYDVTLVVERGPERHVDSTLQIQVTGDTDPVLARDDLPLSGAVDLRAEVHCREGGFVADSLRVVR